MKQQTLTPAMKRQRKFLLALPLILLPFLTLFFWALGGGKVDRATAQDNLLKGFNSQLPDAKLKDNSALNKMSYYDKAALDSDKLRQQMKSDPYYHQHRDTDTAGLHFPQTNTSLFGNTGKGGLRSSKLIGSGNNTDANATQVYQKLAALQAAINKPAALPVNPPTVNAGDPALSPSGIALKSQTSTDDPELQQMNGLLEKILDIEHPERLKPKTSQPADTSGRRFKAIPAVIDGTQKITDGTVVRIKLLDTVTLGGQLIPKGQLLYGSGTLYNQRLTLNLKILHRGYNIIPIDLTVYDMVDGLEGISVPEAVTGDAAKDGAVNGVDGMEFMSMDESMGAQAATAGINAAKGLFSKKIKRIKAKLKDSHPLLLRDNLKVKNAH
jgi:Conjugative transposon, TraM